MAKNQFAAAPFSRRRSRPAWFEAARWPNGPICPNAEAEALRDQEARRVSLRRPTAARTSPS